MKNGIILFFGRKSSRSEYMSDTHLKYYLYSLIIFLGPMVNLAQEKIKQDSSDLNVRYFKENIGERFSDDDFNYSIHDSGGVNLIQKLFQKFFGWINEIFGINLDFIEYKTLEWIVYTLMALGSLYLVFKFLMQAPMDSLFKNPDGEIEGFNISEQDIHEVDLEKLITEASEQNNYRLATRYMYLKTLRHLAVNNIIKWHYDKTNSEYLNEIVSTETHKLFKRISYIYDHVWYGEFALDEEMFHQNKKDFEKLNSI